MSIHDKIKADQIAARKDRDKVKTSILTTLLGELETNAKRDGKESVDDSAVIALVKKFIKSIDETLKAKGDEMSTEVTVLMLESMILEAYLPKQLTEEELRAIIVDYITQEQCGGDLEKGTPMSAIMGHLKAVYSGRYDGKQASIICKEICR